MSPRTGSPSSDDKRLAFPAAGSDCEALAPRFRLWLATTDDRSPFGHGKWRLLAAIEREGSLRASAEALGISYRKAWGDLQKAERILGVKLTVPQRGGTSGGSTVLSDEGRRWLRAYDHFEAEVAEAVTRAYRRTIKKMLP
jgi:molybdate transport system regulatory protein